MKLLDSKTGEARPLFARSLVGRSRACNLRMPGSAVSGEHATIQWTGTSWELKDLGSTNGTFLDGKKLDPGGTAILRAGAALAFGDPSHTHALASEHAPGLLALDLASGQSFLAEDRILALPSEDAPELSIYERAPGEWVQEDGAGQIQPVDDQAIVTVGGRVVRVELPMIHEGTPVAEEGASLDRATLRFSASPDEETVRISVAQYGLVTALEPREHGYLLLLLARKRLAEADKPAAERGWMERDEILRALRIDANGLNVMIFRARQQLTAAGVASAAGIVETRRGQRRIGTDRLVLVPWAGGA